MKLGICIAILFLALAGGVASAVTANCSPLMPTLAVVTAVRPREFPTTSGAAHERWPQPSEHWRDQRDG